jgi:hypothetical protein
MNQTTFTQKPLTARFLAAVTAVAMLLSAFPASFFAFSIAEAATPLTLFEAGFESDNFTEWSNDESPWITVAANGANGSTHRAEVSNTGGDSELRADFSTAGYKNIELTYYLKTNDFEAEDTIKIQYSIDGGNSWTTQKTLTDGVLDNRTTWTPHTLGLSALSGGNVDDQSGFQLRYLANLDSGNDTFKIDDVKITGEPIAPTIGAIEPDAGGNTDDVIGGATNVFIFKVEVDSNIGTLIGDIDAGFTIIPDDPGHNQYTFSSNSISGGIARSQGVQRVDFQKETGMTTGDKFTLRVTVTDAGVTSTKEVQNVTFGGTQVPTLEAVAPATGAVPLATNENFVWTVDAEDVDGDLLSLEIDHSLGANSGTPAAEQLPEPTVYASSTNPYGSTAAENQFTTEGVVVTYDAGAK